MNLPSPRSRVLSIEVDAMAILKTHTDNEHAEIEFELDYLASLTTQQRFDMMLRKSCEMASLYRDAAATQDRALRGRRARSSGGEWRLVCHPQGRRSDTVSE